MRSNGTSAALAVLALSLIIFGGVAPQLIAAQSETAQLQTLIREATAGRAYASSLVGFASSKGIATDSATRLIIAGNSSLQVAQDDLDAGAGLSAGISYAQEAMSNFTKASADLSSELQAAGLVASLDLAALEDGINSANSSAVIVGAAVATVCASTVVNSTLASAFEASCSSAEASVGKASVELGQASEAASASAGVAGANLTRPNALLALARADIDGAATVLAHLATYTYSSRASSYEHQVIDGLVAAANAAVASQASLSAELNETETVFATYSVGQSTAVAEAVSEASRDASDISNVNLAPVTNYASLCSSAADQLSSNLSSFSAGLSVIPDQTIVAELSADASSTQTALAAYKSSLGTLHTQGAMLGREGLSGFSSYLSTYKSDASDVQTRGNAEATALAKLQTDLSTAVNLFPFIQWLLQWPAKFQTLGQQLGSATTNLNGATGSTIVAFQSLEADIGTLSSVSSAASGTILVNATTISTLTSAYDGEAQLLNATALSAVAQAVDSAEATASLSSNFTAKLNSLLAADISSFSSDEASLAAQQTALVSQTTAAVGAISRAAGYASSDLRTRMSALDSGMTFVSEAIKLFASQDVQGGVSVMAKASAELHIASST